MTEGGRGSEPSRKMQNAIRVKLCLVTLLGATMCSGCGTIITHAAKDSVIKGEYSGVRFDAIMIPASTVKGDAFAMPWIIPFCIVDMPLSATLDTAFFPYDLRHKLEQSKESRLLIGFHISDNVDSYTAIEHDYKDYLQKLPPKRQGAIGAISFYESDTGEHAVTIEIYEGDKSASWQHVLIYDRDNKRVKVVRCRYGNYEN